VIAFGASGWMAAAMLASLAVAPFLGLRQPVPPGITLREVAMPGGSTLLVMAREVTRRDWQACVAAGACEKLTDTIPEAAPDMPMTGVNHFDAEAYIAWRNAQGERRYRLPSAEEWRAMAGDLPQKTYRKLFDDPRLAWAAEYGAMEKVSAVVQPSGTFGTLPNGISDLAGNVWEWTASCASEAIAPDRCPAFRVEGAHEAALSVFVRDPASGGCAAGAPPANVGFRLVAED
jgi:formylglycine-generating enzyme required for sulfatase activity